MSFVLCVQERKLATKRKLGQMEEELATASEQIKAQKEEELSMMTKSTRLVTIWSVYTDSLHIAEWYTATLLLASSFTLLSLIIALA